MHTKIIQIERSGSTQTAYWPTAVQPSVTLDQLAADGEIIERPDLSDCVQGRANEKCRVIQVKSGGVYAGTVGRFFVIEQTPEAATEKTQQASERSHCPSCGEKTTTCLVRGTHEPWRATIACLPCNSAADKDGEWTFYVGGLITGKSQGETPTPWRFDGVRLASYEGGVETPIVSLFGDIIRPEDGRRIAACVNACRGLSTEALEAGAIGDMRSSFSKLLELLPKQTHGNSDHYFRELVRMAKKALNDASN